MDTTISCQRFLNSYDAYSRKNSTVVGKSHPIAYGDRIFVRLIMRGKVIVEWLLDAVKDLTELFCTLRNKCRGVSGLAKLYLRNMSRGWSEERPLMFYADGRTPGQKEKQVDQRMISASNHPLTPTNVRERNFRSGNEQMAFHWDY